MSGHAVIFDVDGVLLELTAAEEDLFFAAFADWGDPATLSRDWNSYRIRNDDNIVGEIMERWRIPPAEKPLLVNRYHRALGSALTAGTLTSPAVAGAHDLVRALEGKARLGIATANFREAARLRLAAAALWDHVSGLAHGADGGGHKRDTVAKAIAATGLPKHRIVYVGDNLNDVDAGLSNGVNFIGFATDAARRQRLAAAGARHLSGSHDETARLIGSLLGA